MVWGCVTIYVWFVLYFVITSNIQGGLVFTKTVNSSLVAKVTLATF